ncbi:MAG: 1-deoxy-D-xylulose-5-phosphate reductoisomerase, partial [Desulfobacterales bacterium]|nr:1-deoxy-D-xylulose-5-phosphate reductoisomerase [Desulfobacterales bacterium]
MMKQLSILVSTGSIGRNTLKVVEMFPERFEVKALAAKSSVSLLARQIEQFRPEIAVVFDAAGARKLQELLPAGLSVEIKWGAAAYAEAAAYDSVDMAIIAVVGAAGLLPTLAAIDAGKNIGLANKETLVMAGEIVTRQAAAKGVALLPIDSEHSAIFQCLEGQRREDVAKILLTASGGPFLNLPATAFDAIKPEKALNHPTWQMGKKITIDSATLMNKGLEVIEAKWLFDMPVERIEVVIHPQSMIHSMVAYRDGCVMAQIGVPDMKGAIAYALSYPERLPLSQPLPDFAGIGAFTFALPDFEKFPCLALAVQACESGGTLPAVLNAANEVAVNAFLAERLTFVGIARLIRRVMELHTVITGPTLA